MTLSGIPRERLLAAATLRENAGSASEALQRAAGLRGHPTTSGAPNAAQRGTGRAAKAGKRRGVPNRTEQRFADEVLTALVASGEIDWWEYETLTLRIPGVGAITPDFTGWRNNELRLLFEVKGAVVHEASVLRMKAHAAHRPWWRWQIWKRADNWWALHFDSGVRHGP